jgi:hypothetical protein
MAILKFELNTDEIFGDEYDNLRFEDLFMNGLKNEIVKIAAEKVSEGPIQELTGKIKESVETAVEKKLLSLINEEIVITNRWGKPEFIGSVEDYIKKQIDEKTLAPVGADGKSLQGSCNSSTKTWIEWLIEKEIRSYLSTIANKAEKAAATYCRETLTKELDHFVSKTLSGEIAKRLEAVGIK